jgi:hypothetical protein
MYPVAPVNKTRDRLAEVDADFINVRPDRSRERRIVQANLLS